VQLELLAEPDRLNWRCWIWGCALFCTALSSAEAWRGRSWFARQSL